MENFKSEKEKFIEEIAGFTEELQITFALSRAKEKFTGIELNTIEAELMRKKMQIKRDRADKLKEEKRKNNL